jgi:RNA polymerase sigma-70 factor, ECF subfamily
LAHLNESVQLAEPALVTAANTGDRAAWEVIYRRLYPRLRVYVARRVPAGQVEDTVSEIMVRAVRGIDGYRPGPAGLDGWMFGIARRVCADHHRRRARLSRQDGVAAGMAEVIEDGRAPGDPAAAADDHAELRRAFELLAPGDQQVLELRVIAGLSVEQVAVPTTSPPGRAGPAATTPASRSGLVADPSGTRASGGVAGGASGGGLPGWTAAVAARRPTGTYSSHSGYAWDRQSPASPNGAPGPTTGTWTQSDGRWPSPIGGDYAPSTVGSEWYGQSRPASHRDSSGGGYRSGYSGR